MLHLITSTFTLGVLLLILAPIASAKPVSTAAKTVQASHSSKSLQGVSSRTTTDYPGIVSSPAVQSNNQARHPQASNALGNRFIIDPQNSFGSASIPEPLRINQVDGEYDSQFSVQYKLNR